MHKDFSVSLKADYSLVSVSIYSSFSQTWDIQSPCLHWLLWIQVHISSMSCLPNFQFNVRPLSSKKTHQEFLLVTWVNPKAQLIPSWPAFLSCLLVQQVSFTPLVSQILGTSSPTTIASQVLQVPCFAVLQSNHKPLRSGPLTLYSNGRWIVSASALKKSL